MNNEIETPQTVTTEPAALPTNGSGPPEPGFIKRADAAKKYGISASSLYMRKDLKILPGGWVNEADVVALVNDPKFQKMSAARKAAQAARDAKGHKRSNKPKTERTQRKPIHESTQKAPAIDHHAAYLAGYFQRIIEQYASGHGLPAGVLTSGIFAILSDTSHG